MKFKRKQPLERGLDNSNEDSSEKRRRSKWKFLVVDDAADIIQITRMSLQEFQFAGRDLEILEADSVEAARQVLQRHPDIALAMIDVVMETEDAGLRLVQYIRKDLGNDLIRLLIRTGQPGLAPERYVIDNYDIDGYHDKTELTAQRLYTTVRSAIKAYRDLRAIDLNRTGLTHVLKATQDLYRFRPGSMEEFLRGVLTQIVGLFHLGESALIASVEAMILTLDKEELRIQAGTGDFADVQSEHPRVREIINICQQAIWSNKPTQGLRHDSLILPLQVGQSPIGFIYLEHTSMLTDEDAKLLQIMANQCATALENTRLHMEVAASYDKLVEMVGIIAEYRDRTTGDHINRMARLTEAVSLALGVPEEEAQAWGRAALLHDVGKVAIPDSILKKPGKLDADEYKVIQTHASIGAEILSHDQHLELARTIALNHHEQWDGKGYPNGLVAEQIPLAARVVSVIDVFDALTNSRPYKQAWSKEDALEYLLKEKGGKFDPQVVDAFIGVVNE